VNAKLMLQEMAGHGYNNDTAVYLWTLDGWMSPIEAHDVE
jgi:hypothetical protein